MTTDERRLYLVDAMGLVYRAYYAMIRSPRVTSKGENVSALFGYLNSLLELLDTYDPQYVVVVFDAKGPTFRETELYEEYKANRPQQPEDITAMLPYIKEATHLLGLPTLEVEGYEADDIIATLTDKAVAEGWRVYIVSSDKDFGQLVNDRVRLLRTRGKGEGYEEWGAEEVKSYFGVPPEKVVEVQALAGDATDGIPGVKGIGIKTAARLIAEWGSLEAVYEALDALRPSVRNKLEAGRESAFVSRELARLRRDAPVEFTPELYRRKPPDLDALREFFARFEFRKLAERFFRKYQSDSEAPAPASLFDTIDTHTVFYQVIATDQDWQRLEREAQQADRLGFDTETDDPHPHFARPVGCSWAVKPYVAYYIDLRDERHRRRCRQLLERLHADREFVGHNIKYDLTVMRWAGMPMPHRIADTMVADFLLDPEGRHSLDAAARKYLNYSPITFKEVTRGTRNPTLFRSLDADEIYRYACEDADLALRLHDEIYPKLVKQQLIDVYERIELPIIPVLIDMECHGISLDVEYLQALSSELEERLTALEQHIQQMAGVEFNVNSPVQLGHVLFEVLRLDPHAKKTPKSGQYSTSEKVLRRLLPKHPIIERILEYRMIKKIKSTYVDALPRYVHPKTGRVHTVYNSIGTVTGRLSSSNPNLQNIPIRTDLGQAIRRAFVASEGRVLLSADYSQIELRIMAHMSGDPGLMEAFERGLDVHAYTAARIFNVPIEAVTPSMRRTAKMVNFGLMYGMSAFGLAERLGISRTEAKRIIEEYFRRFPRVKAFMEEIVEQCRRRGYVETLSGRKRWLREINSSNPTLRKNAEREAINTPIQGTAADMIKLAMIAIHRRLRTEAPASALVLQIHDELVLEVPHSDVDLVRSLVVEEMQRALPLRVPIEVNVGVGPNWLDAH